MHRLRVQLRTLLEEHTDGSSSASALGLQAQLREHSAAVASMQVWARVLWLRYHDDCVVS